MCRRANVLASVNRAVACDPAPDQYARRARERDRRNQQQPLPNARRGHEILGCWVAGFRADAELKIPGIESRFDILVVALLMGQAAGPTS